MKTTHIRKHAVLALLLAGIGLSSPDVRADYASYISGTSPVGWWRLNETGATNLTIVPDLSGAYGAANNGMGTNCPMIYNSPGVTTQTDESGYVKGAGNRSAKFIGAIPSGAQPFGGGASGHGDPEIANAASDAPIYYFPTGFSLEVWVRSEFPKQSTADAQRWISTREWTLGMNGGNALQFTTLAKQDYFGGALPNDGNWHQVGISWDGAGTTSFFIDGLPAGVHSGGNPGLRAAIPAGTSGAFWQQISLGRRYRSDQGQQWRGWIDEAVIWNSQRTAADFAASYAAGIVEHQGYAVNFAGTYAPPPAIGAPINVTGPLGPGHAHVATWNNISLGRSVNAGTMIDQDHALTGANGAPSNTFHIHPGNPDGGNDGGPSASQTNDFLRLFGGNIRLGDVYFDISMTPTFATYDLYVYGNGGKNYTLTTNGVSYGTKGTAGPNGTYFYEGNNFVLFTNCSGPFVLRAADSITGFSVVGPEVPGVPYQLLIASTSYDANQERLTLTWNSEPAALYTIEATQLLESNPANTLWDNVTTGIVSGGNTTTRVIDAPAPGTYYRIRKE